MKFGIGVNMVSKEVKLIIAIVLAVGTIIGVVATVESTQASIDYWLEKPDTFARGLNHITAYCKNGGGMDGDFSLVMTFVNVTFSNQTELPYTQMNNSTIKFRFILHKGESNQKMVYFVTDNMTTEFSITLTLEKTDPIGGFFFLKPNSMYPTELSYQWNDENKCFDCKGSQ